MAIVAELTSDDVLDAAYDWLCRRRRAYPADADVWSFRQAWAQEKDKLKAALAAGRYHFGPEGLTLAAKTVEKFVERAFRLYEQEPGEALASTRFGLYVQRWVRWAGAGLGVARGDNPKTPPLFLLRRQFDVGVG
jgi:hypothetical protein